MIYLAIYVAGLLASLSVAAANADAWMAAHPQTDEGGLTYRWKRPTVPLDFWFPAVLICLAWPVTASPVVTLLAVRRRKAAAALRAAELAEVERLLAEPAKGRRG